MNTAELLLVPLDVMLCCNDGRNGNFLGRTECIEVQGIRLVGGSITCEHLSKQLRRAKPVEGKTTLRIGRLQLPCLGYTTWVGNWCWDCAFIRSIHALRLVNHLAEKRDWHCEEAACEIFEAFNERRYIKLGEWERFLQMEFPLQKAEGLAG